MVNEICEQMNKTKKNTHKISNGFISIHTFNAKMTVTNHILYKLYFRHVRMCVCVCVIVYEYQ